MSAQIVWTPRAGAIQRTLDLDDLASGLETRGFIGTTGTMQISVGRKEKAATINSAASFAVRVVGIDHDANPGTDDYPFEVLTSFVSHALAGGLFAFVRDSTKAAATTLSGALAAASGTSTSNVPLTSTTGFAVGDVVYLEDSTDKTRWEIHRISASSTDFDLSEPVTCDYDAGSIFRHWDYFPACAASKVALAERKAGHGVGLWDLDMTIETTR